MSLLHWVNQVDWIVEVEWAKRTKILGRLWPLHVKSVELEANYFEVLLALGLEVGLDRSDGLQAGPTSSRTSG